MEKNAFEECFALEEAKWRDASVYRMRYEERVRLLKCQTKFTSTEPNKKKYPVTEIALKTAYRRCLRRAERWQGDCKQFLVEKKRCRVRGRRQN